MSESEGPTPRFEEAEKHAAPTIIIFGIGPVMDPVTGLKAGDAGITPSSEAINFWSKDLAKAASVLYKNDPSIRFVTMGGQTGGPEYASESELISREMQHHDIPESKIRLETGSLDTAENIINFLNLYTSPDDPVTTPKVDILCAPWHLSRVKLYMQLFKIPVNDLYKSSSLLERDADTLRSGEHVSSLASPKDDALQRLHQMTDPNNLSTFYSEQKGTEMKPYSDRAFDDNLWVRELLQFPERWMRLLPQLNSDKRLKAIVDQAFIIYGTEELARLGITPTDSIQRVREKLQQVHYVKPEDEVQRWRDNATKNIPWPDVMTQRLDTLISLFETDQSEIT